MSQSWKTPYVSTIILKAISVSDPDFNLDLVKGRVVINEEVMIPAPQTTVIKGLTTIRGHHKHIHVLMESSHRCMNVFIPGNTAELKPGKSNIEVVIQNRSGKDVKLKPGTEIGTVIAANIILTKQVSNDFDMTGQERVSSMLAQVKSTDIVGDTSDVVRNDLKDILQKLNLARMEEWEPPLQKAA